ncbi:MAG: Crp/Fnr family transcriptional regulator [Clostridia bacterium]|nr:Crp/Fnr family transcriptional regulator [Clostridia bacterium]
MKKYLEILKKCPLFENISDESLLRMLTCLAAKVSVFDKKYTVFNEGSPAKYIGIVLSGSVQISQTDYFGNRSILGNMGRGEVFAEAFACAELNSMPVSAIATEESEIMLIKADHILHTCENNCGHHQQLIFNLMKDLAKKTIMFHKRIEVTSKRTTREKLLAYLAIEAKEKGSDSFDVPFDRQELADYLEVERSGLSNEISKLREEGIIENRKNHFTLL